MCGINGIVSFQRGSQYRENVTHMNQALAHRGPDDEGVWYDEHIVLGHRRLAIIDLSQAGRQPMVSANERYALVYNGEIYNFRELRQLLSEYPYNTHTDSEVILAAYQRWGVDCVNHFKGMFSFAIWDRQIEQLLLVRDRLGVKPLYYYQGKDYFLFSSELRALLSTNLIPRKLSKASVVDYLRYQTVQAPSTIIEGVSMLMPGCYISIKHAETRSETLNVSYHSYWKPGSARGSSSPEGKSKKSICEDIFTLLSQSVERRLVSDVSFGAFLSGGIDSSAIVGLMSQVMTQPVNTFSVTFEDKIYSEEVYSREIAKRFRTHHQEIYLNASDLLVMLPEALASMDHPSGDGLNTWVISKVTKKAGIDMALSGLGGDELFAGYDLFKRLYFLNKFRMLGDVPRSVRNIPVRLLGMITPSVATFKIQDLLQLENWHLENTYPIMRRLFSETKITELLKETSENENKIGSIIKELSVRGIPFLSQVSIAELGSYMQNILLRDTDQMSMSHALEVRVPFLDYELVEYVLQVNDEVKFPHSPKQLLVESLNGLLPKEIYHRKKMGFVFPWDTWMRNDLKNYCELNLLSLSQFQIFDMNGIRRLWFDFLKGDQLVTWSRIWPLVTLANWLKENKIEN